MKQAPDMTETQWFLRHILSEEIFPHAHEFTHTQLDADSGFQVMLGM